MSAAVPWKPLDAWWISTRALGSAAGGAREAAGRRVNPPARVGRPAGLPAAPAAQDPRRDAGGHPDRGGGHVRLDELHRVVNGEAGVGPPAGTVDVELDVALRV